MKATEDAEEPPSTVAEDLPPQTLVLLKSGTADNSFIFVDRDSDSSNSSSSSDDDADDDNDDDSEDSAGNEERAPEKSRDFTHPARFIQITNNEESDAANDYDAGSDRGLDSRVSPVIPLELAATPERLPSPAVAADTAASYARRRSLTLPCASPVGQLQELDWPGAAVGAAAVAPVDSHAENLESLAEFSSQDVSRVTSRAPSLAALPLATDHPEDEPSPSPGIAPVPDTTPVTDVEDLAVASSPEITQNPDLTSPLVIPAAAEPEPAPVMPVSAPATAVNDTPQSVAVVDDDDDDDLFALLSKRKGQQAAAAAGWTVAEVWTRAEEVRARETTAALSAGHSVSLDDPSFFGAAFECLLLSPAGWDIFVAYARTTFCEENAIFWRDADRLRTCSEGEIAALCESLYAKYFSETGRALNLEHTSSHAITSAFAARRFSRDLFAPAQREVYNLMRTSTFPLFVQHPLFLDAKAKYSKKMARHHAKALSPAVSSPQSSPAKNPGTLESPASGTADGSHAPKKGFFGKMFGKLSGGTPKGPSPAASPSAPAPYSPASKLGSGNESTLMLLLPPRGSALPEQIAVAAPARDLSLGQLLEPALLAAGYLASLHAVYLRNSSTPVSWSEPVRSLRSRDLELRPLKALRISVLPAGPEDLVNVAPGMTIRSLIEAFCSVRILSPILLLVVEKFCFPTNNSDRPPLCRFVVCLRFSTLSKTKIRRLAIVKSRMVSRPLNISAMSCSCTHDPRVRHGRSL
jgi:hypothetical protein